MSTLSVSVIVVVRNGAEYIGHALQSILRQTIAPCEIVVIDGQSTDGTAEIVRDFSRAFPCIRFVKQSVLGLANARNLGLELAQGDLITFLDYDDLWHPRKNEFQVHCLLNHPSAQYVICHLRMFLEKGNKSRANFPKMHLAKIHLGETPSALMAKKTLFREIGGFDPALQIGCDADWFARARDCRVPFEVVSKPLVFKRIHCSNLSMNKKINQRELIQIVRRSIERKKSSAV